MNFANTRVAKAGYRNKIDHQWGLDNAPWELADGNRGVGLVMRNDG